METKVLVSSCSEKPRKGLLLSRFAYFIIGVAICDIVNPLCDNVFGLKVHQCREAISVRH